MPITFDVTNVETGTSGNDSLVAAPLVSNLTDTTYAYQFDALGGDDTIIGSPGPLGWVTLTSGQDDPVLLVESYLYGGEGNDLLIASSGYHQILNDAQQLGYSLSNSLFGGDGNDILRGGRLGDALYGDAGDDTMSGGGGNDLIFGGEDNDRLLGAAGDDYMSGDAGNDIVVGGDGNDSLYSGDGDDAAFGGNGDDDLYGGIDDDRLVGGDGSDVLTGDAGNDSLYGGTGNDQFYGGAGDDLMVGGGGTEIFEGGAGNDTYRLSSASDTVIEAEAGGDDKIQTGSFDLSGNNYANVETLQLTGFAALNIFGSLDATTLIGNRGGNMIFAGAASSTLRGGDGNDILHGSSADDVLSGGRDGDEMTGYEGNDWYSVDSLNDSVVEGSGSLSGNDTVSSSTISLTGVNYFRVEVLELTGEADLDLTGGDFVVEMRGNAGNNIITTTDGRNETVSGGAGNDTIHVSRGNDIVSGGDGADVFVFAGSFSSLFDSTTITDFNAAEDIFDISGLAGTMGGNYSVQSVVDAGTYVTLTYGIDSTYQIILVGQHTITDANFIGLLIS